MVRANVSTEPSYELAASSSQNSLPGGSFMEINTDMKKALKGAYTCVPGSTPTQKETRNSLFTSFPGMCL